jgi:hypothetical protein
MLKYDQATGELFDSEGNLLGMGYSGRDPYKNDPSAEGLVDEGPIPRGFWKLASLELTTPLHGPYVIVLKPGQSTRTRIVDVLKRDPDSFRIHGDSVAHLGSASSGCIVLGRSVREQIWTGMDRDLEVV